MESGQTAFNDSQRRRLIVTCQYVDRLLGDLERSFVEASSSSPFRRYVDDLAPAERRVVQDYIARIRTQLVRVLAVQGLSPSPRPIGLRHSLLTHLEYVDVAVEELKPRYMKGYGTVSPSAAATLEGVVEELHGTIGQLTRALRAHDGEDVDARVARIDAAADGGVLELLAELISKYGLVEYRAALATILDTLERRGLELAVFGRVSTGKSSLLNRLLGRDVLPVGVVPITAVPTRITFGSPPRLRIWFADAPPREMDVAALPAFASERENPANVKRVIRLVVELPAPFLEPGITLVDTPGLGSLATAGAEETMAYLPHCDVAAVLVDAASTLNGDDVTTIRLLMNAGVRVSVLLSKADLVSDGDRDLAVRYVHDALARELGADFAVAPVSVKPEFSGLFEQWRAAELAPLLADQERERRRAAARKTAVLRSQVAATLRRWRADDPMRRAAPDTHADPRAADTRLQDAAGRIAVLEQRIDETTLLLPRRTPEVVAAAAALAEQGRDADAAVRDAFRDVAGDLARTLGRELESLFASLTTIARDVSATVQWGGSAVDTPAGQAPLHEMPVPELPPALDLPALGVERVLGSALARSILAARLRHAAGVAIEATLASYAAVLRRWALDRLGEIRAEWAATTDALRAEIDRRLGHAARGEVSGAELARDLDRLAGAEIPG